MSLTQRPVDPELETLLMDNEPYKYAHLVKFERPSRPDSRTGLVSTAEQRYAYFTDASVNIKFNDGTTDLNGVPNGTQVYLANKLYTVGAIQEQTKATAAQTSISLDGNALGAQISGLATITSQIVGGLQYFDIQFSTLTAEDLLAEGFREGDKITVANTVVNIHSFRANNVLRVSRIDDVLVTYSTPTNITLAYSSEEIISILLNKNATDYSSFINREVFIYRAYFDADGVQRGAPVPLFKGIINNVSFEDTEAQIKVTWGLTSHWGDFAQVKGRITSDTFHRALDENGRPQIDSALKPLYAYDKGFTHAETSINMLTKYMVTVEKQDVKYRKGFLGIGSKVKVKTFNVQEERTTNLDFQIQAKSLPLVYGVRKIEGIPIFADTKVDNSGEVYVVLALCEGEIGGIYDAYIESKSLICNDAADFDARSSQNNSDTVELICRGRADKGEVLGGSSALTSVISDFDWESFRNLDFYGGYYSNFYGYTPPTPEQSTPTGYGIIDGETITLTSPQNVTVDFFSGKPAQKASAQLINLATSNSFKVQEKYWEGTSAEYWGPNHRLLDTAYIVIKVIIEEGSSTIPDTSFVVRGKIIDCYNYDYSYKHYGKDSYASENADNFNLGDFVDIHRADTDAVINSQVQIIDKWSFYYPDGTKEWRFRFSTPPAIYSAGTYEPVITRLYMKKGANMWNMSTYNHQIYPAATIATTIESNITGTSNISGSLGIQYSSNSLMAIEGDPIEVTPSFQIVNSDYTLIEQGELLASSILTGSGVTATLLTSKFSHETAQADLPLSSLVGKKLVSKNTVQLPSAVAVSPVGDTLELTRVSTTGKLILQTAPIVAYDSESRIVTIDGILEFIPRVGDTVRIVPKWADSRISINPVIQTLDYITSQTYGKGLSITKDIDLNSWAAAARNRDTGSDVTVRSTTSTSGIALNSIYRWTDSNGVIIWQGKVARVHDTNYVTFTDVIGKLTNKWQDWKDWKLNELVYNPAGSLYRVTNTSAANAVITAPVHKSGTESGYQYLSSLSLTRVGGGTLPLIVDDNPVQSIKNGAKISGYSLYDSDGIDYWRYCGWDEHAQRYVNKSQTNIIIDTSQPLFDNINAFLEHFGGILRYTAGKYYLDVEDTVDTINDLDDVRVITADDIIGRIQLSDEGTRSAFNSLTAAFADPSNKYDARNISFFNSDYLKSDRNVPKKGNLSIPGITNYYNTRLLADNFLNKSRFGLTINMTIRPKGLLLLAGTVIQVTYPRYDWVSPGKKFRIESVNYQPDGLVDIVAKEYDSSFYSLSNVRAPAASGPDITPSSVLIPSGNKPTQLVATQDRYNQIVLSWQPGPGSSSSSFTEIWRSDTNNINEASIIALVPITPGTSNTYVDSIAPEFTGDAYVPKYYWVRRRVNI
jgi:hypothetical protein